MHRPALCAAAASAGRCDADRSRLADNALAVSPKGGTADLLQRLMLTADMATLGAAVSIMMAAIMRDQPLEAGTAWFRLQAHAHKQAQAMARLSVEMEGAVSTASTAPRTSGAGAKAADGAGLSDSEPLCKCERFDATDANTAAGSQTEASEVPIASKQLPLAIVQATAAAATQTMSTQPGDYGDYSGTSSEHTDSDNRAT